MQALSASSCVQHPSSVYKVQHLGKYVVIIKRQFVRDLCSVGVREQSLLCKKRLATLAAGVCSLWQALLAAAKLFDEF